MLLPPGLPDIEGWSVAALYEPAGEAVLVGGDFYDWFTMPDGRMVLLFGDVAGKGPLAGAAGMSLRKALKGAAVAVGDPVAALPLVEVALADEMADTFASMCIVEIEPLLGRVKVTLAGHPAPWARLGGVFGPVAAPPNRLVGIGVGGSSWESTVLRFDPGDLLFVYTDGLSEAGAGGGRQLYGEGPLQDFLASLPAELPPYEVVLQADADLRRWSARPGDDVIIAALGFAGAPGGAVIPVRSGGGEVRTVELLPASDSPRIARQLAVEGCREWGLTENVSYAVQTVVSELVTNAVIHARTRIELKVLRIPGFVRVEVRDYSSRPVQPKPAAATSVAQHGRGLFCVETLSAQFGVEAEATGKLVWAAVPLGSPER